MSKVVDKIIADAAPRMKAAILAYQSALRRRADWHVAIQEAVAAADAFDDQNGVHRLTDEQLDEIKASAWEAGYADARESEYE